MRPRFQADENLNGKIIAGLLRREPAVDIKTAKEANLLGRDDPDVLAAAAQASRILVSHDRDTMPGHFAQFIRSTSSPALLVVSQTMDIGEAIEQILIVWAASEAHEWINRVGYMPVLTAQGVAVDGQGRAGTCP